MAKVHRASFTRKPSVRFSRLSLCYSALFVVKLATTPLFAYLTEPLPWLVPLKQFVQSTSFDEFNNATFAFLQSHFNNQTIDDVCTFDSATISFAVRHELSFPLAGIPSSDAFQYLVKFPGAMLYGAGLRHFVETFLSQDAVGRRSKDWYRCQRNFYFGVHSSDFCVWFEPHDATDDSGGDVYTVYMGSSIWEDASWSWLKMTFRCLLTAYVLHVLWQSYCRHFGLLLTGLRLVGVGERYNRYQVIVGDPTTLILSNPLVSLVMVIDSMLAPSYIAWSLLRVCQFKDSLSFFLGLFYTSRFVWSGYLVMRCLSYVIKWQQWEAKFAPLDPGILAFVACLYGGPLLSLIGITPLMAIFHAIWGLFLPPAMRDEAIEDSVGVIMGSVLMASFPIIYSITIQRIYHHARGLQQRSRRDRVTNNFRKQSSSSTNDMVHWESFTVKSQQQQQYRRISRMGQYIQSTRYTERSFNDFKNRVFFTLFRRVVPEPSQQLGGSLHKLYERSPQYRKMPLFSCRAADCFVLCYTPNDKTPVQIRLSFLDCLDKREDDPHFAVAECTSQHDTSYAILSTHKCRTFQPTIAMTTCIHTSRIGGKWIA
ncbi:hypothetical protein AC1031_015005 [Aphanomyces cochlioides]|nr:hypothetical protein AC1031_015005 [Aphanomyces cochlioides]